MLALRFASPPHAIAWAISLASALTILSNARSPIPNVASRERFARAELGAVVFWERMVYMSASRTLSLVHAADVVLVRESEAGFS